MPRGFRTTGEAQYEQAFVAALPDDMAMGTGGWGSLAPFAYWTYCLAEKAKPYLRAGLMEATQDAATLRILRSSENGYGNSLRLNDYRWGSNSAAANDGLLLLLAHGGRNLAGGLGRYRRTKE